MLKDGEVWDIRIDGKSKKRMYYHKTQKEFIFDEQTKTNFIYSHIKEQLEGKDGQLMLFPEYEIESYYSTLDETIENIMEIYQMHGTCEQFHSELKSDMDIERMPSGKFSTNDVLLHVAIFTYNLLRMIGQISININRTKRENTHLVVRCRLKTAINDMIG